MIGIIYNSGTADERIHPFEGELVIGRRQSRDGDGRITISDNAVSGRHCVIRQSGDGRFFVRDVSRNGTRINGRRLVPNVEVEVFPGNHIAVTKDHMFLLSVEHDVVERRLKDEDDIGTTRAIEDNYVDVTVLVGDITGYTTLTQQKDAQSVYSSTKHLFASLEGVIYEHGGTIKEYQGDAVFAFWEAEEANPQQRAPLACEAALALAMRVRELARDTSVWSIPDFPLRMDWALTSGPVLLSTLGGDRPVGLALVGDAVNYAFRLEKLATGDNPILLDKETNGLLSDRFVRRPLGDCQVKGRTNAEPVFSLVSIR